MIFDISYRISTFSHISKATIACRTFYNYTTFTFHQFYQI